MRKVIQLAVPGLGLLRLRTLGLILCLCALAVTVLVGCIGGDPLLMHRG
jgi:hypothetical protein